MEVMRNSRATSAASAGGTTGSRPSRGWSFELLDDRRLVVRTPSGVSRVSVPPGWCYDEEPDPPWLDEEAPPDRLRC
jgi:hypothetical protein